MIINTKGFRPLYITAILILISFTFLSGKNEVMITDKKVFFISTGGSDDNIGAFSEPFATLEKAQAEARDLLHRGYTDTILIYLREGVYRRSLPFQLNEKDAGSFHTFIIYSAYQNEKVSINGGIAVSPQNARPVSDPAILKRFNENLIGEIYQVDLKNLGITEYGKLRPRGFRRPYYPSAMELFSDKKPMKLARWPNEGYAKIGKTIDSGSISRNGDYSGNGGKFSVYTSRLERWKNAEELWISGYFHYGYADDAVKVKELNVEDSTISTIHPTMYGYSDGNSHLGWYAFNLMEEIDKPGEYFIDRKEGILYFYPFSRDFELMELSMLEDPLVIMKNCTNIIFRNITFECSRGMGIYIEGGEGNQILNSEFRNLGLMAICVGRGIEPFRELRHDGTGVPASAKLGSWHEHIYRNPAFNRIAGKNHLISGCHIYNTGSGGVSLSGGDRITLEKGFNTVENCYIHDFNRLDKTYRAGVNIDGVGNRILHCEIAHCPGSAIYLHGNDHLIAFNEIHHAVMEGDDMGAVYYGRDPSESGNIVRNNFFHHLGSGDMREGHRKIIGIYHDDGACGMEVTGNIFYKAGSRGANIGGGNDNVYRNNIFIDGKLAIHVDNRLQGWASDMWKAGGIFEERLRLINYQQTPYSVAYPELADYFIDRPGLPKRNYIENNVFIEFDLVYDGKPEFSNFGKNLVLCDDPGFENIDSLDFSLKPGSVIFRLLPDFTPIPVNKIGRKKRKQ